MSDVLKAPITPSFDDIEAASGRFFNSQQAYRFSRDFWATSGDLLPSDLGLVVLVGVDDVREYFDARDHIGASALSVLFDARQRTVGHYTWQVTLAKAGVGRETRQLYVTPEGWQAQTFRFNHQGQLRTVEQTEPANLADLIAQAIEHPLAKQQAADLRELRQKAENTLARSSVEQLGHLSVAKYDKTIGKYQKHADQRGYPIIFPFEPPVEQQPTETFTQLPLFWGEAIEVTWIDAVEIDADFAVKRSIGTRT